MFARELERWLSGCGQFVALVEEQGFGSQDHGVAHTHL